MNKYLKAISTNLVFLGINSIFFLIITPLAIKVMGNEFFGLWSVLQALILISSNIGTLGIGVAINKLASESHAEELDNMVFFGRIISAGALIVLPMAILAAITLNVLRYWIAASLVFSGNQQLEFSRAIQWAALALIPQFLISVPSGFLLSQLRNDLVRGLEVSSNMLIWLGAVLIAYKYQDIVMIAKWSLFLNLIVYLIYMGILARMKVLIFIYDLPAFRRILRLSLFTFTETLASSLFQQFDRVLVGFVLGPVAAGVYTVGTSIGLRLTMIARQFTEVMIPYASLRYSLNDEEHLYRVFRHLSGYISLLTGTLGSLLIVWMDVILDVWISPEYALHYTGIFRLLILAYSLFTLAHPGRQTLFGIGQIRLVALVYLGVSSGMLISVYILSINLGLIGSAIGNLFMILLLSFNIFVYSKLTGGTNWVHVFSDLRWGVILPLSAYVGLNFYNVPWINFVATLILALIISVVVWRDRFLRVHVLQRLNAARLFHF